MALNLNSIMLNSSDYKRLAAFYGDVLQKEPEMVDDEHGLIGYMAGSCFISLCAHDKVTGPNQTPERSIIFFETVDVTDEFERIKQIPGATVVKAPYNPSSESSAQIATLADFDGNYFQLVTPWDAE